jgi:DNA polymerase-3 subunit delta'
VRKEDIPGQQQLKSVFTSMVDNNRLPHALLVHGTGAGTALALGYFLIAYLLCEEKNGVGPCGVCSNCQRNQNLQHPDVHYIYPINKTKTIKSDSAQHSESFLEDWRKMHSSGPYFTLQDWFAHLDIENKQGFIGSLESTKFRQKIALRSYEGGYKVFMIWGADKMNPAFANKVLKNLEEPSDKTLIILITEQPKDLLTTILSRVQRFQEEPLSEEDLQGFLQERFELSEAEAMNMAFRAEGNAINAIKEVEHGEDEGLERFKLWMRLAYKQDMIGLFDWSVKTARLNREQGRLFIKSALNVLDRCFRMGWVETNIPMEGEEAEFYKNFSPFIDSGNIEYFMELLQEASFHIERNVNEKIVWYDASIKAVRFIHAGRKRAAQA